MGAALLVIACGPSAAHASHSFTGPTNFGAGGPAAVAVGDFNGDSDPDLAVANVDSDNVSILLGAAGTSFSDPTNFPVRNGPPLFPADDGPTSIAVADFNGDSDPDLAVALPLSDRISVLFGGVGGSFSGPTSLDVGNEPRSVAAGDFNGDSDPDLAVPNHFSDSVSILLGGAGGSFTGPTGVPAGDAPQSVSVGDFNGDSDPDLVVANRVPDTVSILVGGAGASFAAPTSFGAGDRPETVAVRDFNGDSDPDLAVANSWSDNVSVLVGGAGASFTGPANFSAGDEPASVAAGDFDGDSDPDLVVANANSDNVSVLLGGAGASFTGPTNLSSGDGPRSVAVGDFNGDSDPDLAVANQFSDSVSTFAGSTGAGFTGLANLSEGSLTDAVAVGDFNGDSDPDLAVANRLSDDVSILLGGAGGDFTFAPGSPFPAGDAPTSVAVGDFNGDSDPDLAIGDINSDSVSILVGGAGASFSGPTTYPAGDELREVVVADFNGDSDPDLAVANSFSDNVSILLGSAGAGFTGPTNFSIGFAPDSLAVGDFNGDADPDLAVTGSSTGNGSILVGGSGGSFTVAPGSPFGAGCEPRSVAVGEFNGDSDPDLAIANGFCSHGVRILLGSTGASFTGPANFAVGGAPADVAVGDFNGDSDPDLAVTSSSLLNLSHNVAILRGGAGGSFSEPSFFAAGDGPFDVVVGEFNGDSDPDLAVANLFSNNVSILLGSDADDGYPRPKGASPLRVSLVPAYVACTAPNREHGPPLAFGSCNPPTQTSPNLTIGSPDANGAQARSVGWVRYAVIAGNPGAPDDSDISVNVSIADVRCTAGSAGVPPCGNANFIGGPDYAGEVEARVSVRMTDRFNGLAPGGGTEPATVADTNFAVPVQCVSTAFNEIGGLCSVTTSANTLVPGLVKDTKRAIWQFDQVQVFDGGPDGDPGTAGNSLFATQGVFVP